MLRKAYSQQASTVDNMLATAPASSRNHEYHFQAKKVLCQTYRTGRQGIPAHILVLSPFILGAGGASVTKTNGRRLGNQEGIS